MQKIYCTAKSKDIVKKFHNQKKSFYLFKNIIKKKKLFHLFHLTLQRGTTTTAKKNQYVN